MKMKKFIKGMLIPLCMLTTVAFAKEVPLTAHAWLVADENGKIIMENLDIANIGCVNEPKLEDEPKYQLTNMEFLHITFDNNKSFSFCNRYCVCDIDKKYLLKYILQGMDRTINN